MLGVVNNVSVGCNVSVGLELGPERLAEAVPSPVESILASAVLGSKSSFRNGFEAGRQTESARSDCIDDVAQADSSSRVGAENLIGDGVELGVTRATLTQVVPGVAQQTAFETGAS